MDDLFGLDLSWIPDWLWLVFGAIGVAAVVKVAFSIAMGGDRRLRYAPRREAAERLAAAEQSSGDDTAVQRDIEEIVAALKAEHHDVDIRSIQMNRTGQDVEIKIETGDAPDPVARPAMTVEPARTIPPTDPTGRPVPFEALTGDRFETVALPGAPGPEPVVARLLTNLEAADPWELGQKAGVEGPVTGPAFSVMAKGIASTESATEDAAEGDDTDTSDAFLRRVLFGTDRLQSGRAGDVTAFGHTPSETLSFGVADVSVPRERTWGKVARPRRLVGITIEKEKEHKHFILKRCDTVDEEAFIAAAAEEAASSENSPGSAFVYVHGFNVTFEAAIYRAAQMAADIKFDGPMFAYSWPAVGGGLKGIFNYATDMQSAEHAAPHLDQFIDTVLRVPGVERIQMITHSMGNQLLAHWFDEPESKLRAREGKTIDQLILAAPDIDLRTFKKLSGVMDRFANGATLLACASDVALNVSKSLRPGHPRAGDVPRDTGPIISEGIDTIDISAVGNRILSLGKYLGDKGFLDHSLYAEDREVLTDIGNLIRDGVRPPSRRTTLYDTARSQGRPYWVLPD